MTQVLTAGIPARTQQTDSKQREWPQDGTIPFASAGIALCRVNILVFAIGTDDLAWFGVLQPGVA
jgi:hypothetical protein